MAILRSENVKLNDGILRLSTVRAGEYTFSLSPNLYNARLPNRNMSKNAKGLFSAIIIPNRFLILIPY